VTASSAGGLTADVSARAVDRARPGPGVRAVHDAIAAWSSSSLAWRGAAIAAILAGVLLAVLGRVPFASGLAVAALVPAALVDVRQHRLPDPWVAAAAITLATLSAVTALVGTTEPVPMLIGAAAMAGPMLVLHLVSPDAMGFGDVKAGVVLGGALGAVAWQLALAGLALAAGSTSVVAITRGRREVAFGPGLVAGSLVALAAHPTFLASAELTT
jgi:leader peptidase (prepilin peptidase)/N-methyltransferase